MPTISDFLIGSVGGVTKPISGTWVRLTNNSTLASFVASAATDAVGTFTVSGVPPGTYTVATGPTASGPFTNTTDVNYFIGADVGGASNTFTGALTVAGLLDAQGSVTMHGAGPWFDVKESQFSGGAKGDGVTDDTTAIQAANDAAVAAGAGIVYFPPGTYIAAGLNWDSFTHWRGAGAGATILKLKNASNTFLVQSRNFATLTGTNGTGGVTLCGIYDMTMDGNRANNGAAAVPVFRSYGFGRKFVNLHVKNGNDKGWYSEWSTSLPTPGGDSMMDQVVNCKSHDNGLNGIHWLGPHDSQFVNLEVYLNNQNAVATTAGAGIFVDKNANAGGDGCKFTNCHSWGLSQRYAWYLNATGIKLNGCNAEGATTFHLVFNDNDCTWVGGMVQSQLGGTSGFRIGDTKAVTDSLFVGSVLNCNVVGINFNNDGGGSYVRAFCFQTSGPATSGTPAGTSSIDVNVWGGGTAGMVRQPQVADFFANVQVHSGNAIILRRTDDTQFATLAFDGSQVTNTWPYQAAAGQFVAAGAGIRPGTAAGAIQGGNLFMGSGVPSNANGNNGDFYFRTDTPGTANQRLYNKSAGAWVALTL